MIVLPRTIHQLRIKQRRKLPRIGKPDPPRRSAGRRNPRTAQQSLQIDHQIKLPLPQSLDESRQIQQCRRVIPTCFPNRFRWNRITSSTSGCLSTSAAHAGVISQLSVAFGQSFRSRGNTGNA